MADSEYPVPGWAGQAELARDQAKVCLVAVRAASVEVAAKTTAAQQAATQAKDALADTRALVADGAHAFDAYTRAEVDALVADTDAPSADTNDPFLDAIIFGS